MKRLQNALLIVGVTILDTFFFWSAIRLFSANPNLSTMELYLVGIAACFGGIFVASGRGKQRFTAGGAIFAVGVYYFLRATRVIDVPLLTTLLGIVSLLIAGVLTYAAVVSIRKPRAATS